MAVVDATVEETLVEGPKGKPVDGVSLTCGDCDLSVELPGRDSREIRQCLIECLNTQCPEHRRHTVQIVAD